MYECISYFYAFLQFIQNQQMFQNKVLASTGLTPQDYTKTLATHKTFLSKFRILPDKTRKSTYKQLLLLPNNYGHLQQLTKPYQILPEHGYNKQLAITTDALGRLYPQLKNQWLPSMIFPFVKLFQQDYTFSFQCSLTFLLNWLKPILFDFPNANKEVMEIFQNQLPDLKFKIQSLDYPLSSLINPMFVVTLTDVVNKKDWLQLCDFWVTNPFQPWHYLSVAIALVQSIEDQLQKLFSVEQMSLALRKEKNIEIEVIIHKAKAISSKYKQKFVNIYKDTIFPIQKGRYPVAKFFRTPIRKTNSKLQIQDDIQKQQIVKKYQQLELMLQNFINTNHVSDQQAIENKYEMVEGQVRQYLNLIKQQHANKMAALKEIQTKFNYQLQKQGKQRKSNINAIQKRARLQRQIEIVLAQSESIKQMQGQMMKRMKECIKIKKNQLRKINQSLKGR